MQSFSVEIEKWAKEARASLDDFAVEFAQDLNEEIVRRTPVDTGFLRASWFSNVGARPSGVATSGDTGGAVTIAKMNLVAAGLKYGDTYFMSNGAAYAMRLELGFTGRDALGRYYNQPPRAFVRGVMGRAQKIANETAKRLGGIR